MAAPAAIHFPVRRWRPPAWAIAASLLTLAVGAWPLFQARADRRRAVELVQRARSTGALSRHPELRREILTGEDPVRTELRLARVLLADELQRDWLLELSPDERAREAEQGLDRLRLVQAIAREGMARRPLAWQPPMLLGGAIYLEWLRTADPRLLSQADTWRQPLHRAVELGPGQPEPVRLLAAVLLDNWERLDAHSRRQATRIVEEALRDPRSFELLHLSWLAVAPDRATAFRVIPQQVTAWEQVARAVSQTGDWDSLRLVRREERRARLAELDATIEEARASRGFLDVRRTRELLQRVIASAPPDRGFLPLFSTALEELPPGPVTRWARAGMQAWLSWTLDRERFGERPIDPAAVQRLAAAAEASRAQRARAALAAGDRSVAERLEREGEDLTTREWAGYFTLKARQLVRAGQPAAAGTALELVPLRWRDHLFWQVQEEVAAARRQPAARALAATRLRAHEREAWPAEAWRWERGRAHLELVAARAADGVAIWFVARPRDGGVLELAWDGTHIGYEVVPAEGDPIFVRIPVTPGPHELRVGSASSRRALPGEVRLLPQQGTE